MRIRQAQRAKLIERSGNMCEIRWEGCLRYANNAHHRKNAGQGGTDDLSNLLMACGSGTTGCHGWITNHPVGARARGWAMWRSDTPAEVPVLYRGAWARLDDEGYVYLLKRGVVRHELGHLSIGDTHTDAGHQ